MAPLFFRPRTSADVRLKLPVTPGVAGSSPVHSAKYSFSDKDLAASGRLFSYSKDLTLWNLRSEEVLAGHALSDANTGRGLIEHGNVIGRCRLGVHDGERGWNDHARRPARSTVSLWLWSASGATRRRIAGGASRNGPALGQNRSPTRVSFSGGADKFHQGGFARDSKRAS